MMKLTNVVVVLLLAVAGAGCSEKVNVEIDCITTAERAIECDVKQTQGKREVEACWEFFVECANGAVVEAPRTCQKVKDGATAKVKITSDKLTNLDKCGGDGPPKGKLVNMTLNGEKPDKFKEK